MNQDLGVLISPITLLLAGILISIGLLSLLDLHFLKTSLQGKVALALGLAFLVATEAMFVTSGDDGRYLKGLNANVTDCEFQAEQAHPLERGKSGGAIAADIRKCMNRLGYEWTAEHRRCQEARIATNSFCYLPQETFERMVVAFQMKFE